MLVISAVDVANAAAAVALSFELFHISYRYRKKKRSRKLGINQIAHREMHTAKSVHARNGDGMRKK